MPDENIRCTWMKARFKTECRFEKDGEKFTIQAGTKCFMLANNGFVEIGIDENKNVLPDMVQILLKEDVLPLKENHGKRYLRLFVPSEHLEIINGSNQKGGK